MIHQACLPSVCNQLLDASDLISDRHSRHPRSNYLLYRRNLRTTFYIYHPRQCILRSKTTGEQPSILNTTNSQHEAYAAYPRPSHRDISNCRLKADMRCSICKPKWYSLQGLILLLLSQANTSRVTASGPSQRIKELIACAAIINQAWELAGGCNTLEVVLRLMPVIFLLIVSSHILCNCPNTSRPIADTAGVEKEYM